MEAESPLCLFCDCPVPGEESKSLLQEAGAETIIEISEQIQDGIAEKLLLMSYPIITHIKCRRKYTKPSSISAVKRRKLNEEATSAGDIGATRRSQTQQYNLYTDCCFCSRQIRYFRNCSRETPRNYDYKVQENFRGRCFETVGCAQTILQRAKDRKDAWGQAVEYRLTPLILSSDLVAREAKYHTDYFIKYFF